MQIRSPVKGLLFLVWWGKYCPALLSRQTHLPLSQPAIPDAPASAVSPAAILASGELVEQEHVAGLRQIPGNELGPQARALVAIGYDH